MVVFRANFAGDHFSERKFIVGGLLESDGKGVELASGQRGGQSGHGAGVDPSAQEDADLDIAPELVANGLPQKVAGGLGGFVEGARAHWVVLNRKIPKIFRAATGGGPDDHLAGFQFPHPGIGGGGCGDVTEGEILVDGGGIETGLETGIAKERAKLRGEKEFSPMVGVVKGFDAQGIAGQGETFLAGIPDGEGEHAVEAWEAIGTILCPGLEEDFRVGLGLEHDPTGLQIPSKFDIVVNFPVKNDVPPTVGGGHGLSAAGQVENTEATVSQPDGGIAVGTLGIRSAVGEGVGHAGEGHFRFFRLMAMRGESGNAAHRSLDSITWQVVSSQDEGRVKD
jgi:hypothetical protein